jgi:Pyruvate/2-oxoacid:ferredoxin oxidoreductase delta subunit
MPALATCYSDDIHQEMAQMGIDVTDVEMEAGESCGPVMTFLVSAPAEGSPTVPSKRMDLVDCVHYYKDAMLGRFYAICNCCSCCLSRAQPRGCGAMEAQRNGTPMLASSGYVAVLDADLCAACGTCAEYCQFAAISVNDGFARIDAAACMGCGVCVAHCPQEAIALVRDSTRGEPLEIEKLIAEAAVTDSN